LAEDAENHINSAMGGGEGAMGEEKGGDLISAALLARPVTFYVSRGAEQ
jgi:hypothetical protein